MSRRTNRLHWRKAKTLAMLANRKQAERDHTSLITSTEIEIELEQGGIYLRTETSTYSSPTYIITE
jgi:hypothetical protein